MLSELSKKNQKWYNIALSLCKDSDLAKDLVQEMYLKIYDLEKTEVNDFYIAYTIRHLFFNHLKKSAKTVSLEEDFIQDNHNFETLKDRKSIAVALEELSLIDREVLLHISEDSLRIKEKELGISYGKLHYLGKNALKKLSQTDTVKQLRLERKAV